LTDRIHPSASDRVVTRVRIDGAGKQALEVGRTRLVVGAGLFALAFLGLAVRLISVGLFDVGESPSRMRTTDLITPLIQRADITDRNSRILATSLNVHSLYADPRMIDDPSGVAARLAEILVETKASDLERKLGAKNEFVWVKRGLAPRQVYAVNRLGIPGLAFLPEVRRTYPTGPLAAHIVGQTNIDNHGVSGLENRFDETLRANPTEPLALSVDIRFQHVLREELAAAVKEFSAIGAAGVIVDVRSGEVLSMVSLPDYNPNRAMRPVKGNTRFNRASLGVYEMGSTFKAFTTAMALDSGTIGITEGYDASKPLRMARFTIRDFHAQNRWLSVPEIFMYSSNIGAAKMALEVGVDGQRAFLSSLGLLQPASIELPEVSTPLFPKRWRDVNVATIGFGHGIAVSPLQLAVATAALVNGGTLHQPTLILGARDNVEGSAELAPTRVISEETSYRMRQLFRLVVAQGTGRRADVAAYPVGGKTGTAEKSGANGYDSDRLISSFVGAFPINDPRYVVLVMLDEPKGTASTKGYATGGWTAAPVIRRVITRVGPLAGLEPSALPAAELTAESEPFLTTPDGVEIRLASF
jgi:cell division protein FtsI (penicillin-binding protein 3)